MDDRKLKILNSIIKSYTESREPVGSRTLSKETDLGVSAATIRNDMSDLEDLGYLVKVHSSSGRIPSNRGYRLYVDALLSDKVPFGSSGNELIDTSGLNKSDEFDSVISNATKILSAITNYTSVAVIPESENLLLRYINVVMLGSRDLAIIYIYNTKSVRHESIRLNTAVNLEKVNLINSILNSSLINLNPKEIIEKLHSNMFEVLRVENQTLDFLIPRIEEEVRNMGQPKAIYEGLGNIYKYNNLDIDGNKELIDYISKENPIIEILSRDDREGLQIYIGDEIGIDAFNNLSIISMNFNYGEGIKGRLAVIGPMVMKYDKVISDLLLIGRYIMSNI